jgi:hypothetical protein
MDHSYYNWDIGRYHGLSLTVYLHIEGTKTKHIKANKTMSVKFNSWELNKTCGHIPSSLKKGQITGSFHKSIYFSTRSSNNKSARIYYIQKRFENRR